MNSLFDVKSARLDVLSLQLRNDDFGQLETALEQRLKQLGDFASMPFVLDLEQISNAPDLPVDKLVRMFRRHGPMNSVTTRTRSSTDACSSNVPNW